MKREDIDQKGSEFSALLSRIGWTPWRYSQITGRPMQTAYNWIRIEAPSDTLFFLRLVAMDSRLKARCERAGRLRGRARRGQE